MIYQIKHIKPNELILFQQATKEYYLRLENDAKTSPINNIETEFDKSISKELWYEFQKKANKETQPKNTSLKLRFHKAYVLAKALIYFQELLDKTSKENATTERYKSQLIQHLHNFI